MRNLFNTAAGSTSREAPVYRSPIDLHSFFTDGSLQPLAETNRSSFEGADPFPHVVLDDFLPAAVAEEAAASFPSADDIAWGHYQDAGRTEKLATSDEAVMPAPLRQLIWALNAGPTVRFLETLTGITGLVADPHLGGGGLHRIEQGGFLDVHADFNIEPHLRLDRRLNLLLYLNPGWDEAWGGQLELWDRERGAVRSILPVMNRCVVFATTDDALHGHPTPLTCPPEVARQSVALYYYSNGRPAQERSPAHSTLYLRAGGFEEPARARVAARGRVARRLRRT
jgi:hypothetical protein